MIERKVLGGKVVEVKEAERNGQPVGIVEGYLSAWGPDTGIGARYGIPDRFHPGAWLKSIQNHKDRGNRQVRFKDGHFEIIGGFPIDTVKEDSRGLFGVGEINLVKQAGKELYSLAKQQVITDFSVGFVSKKDEVGKDYREIFEAELFEASLVGEPMHQGANVTEVKSFEDFKLADRDDEFPDSAKTLWFWQDQLPFAEVKDGIVLAYPKAIIECANAIIEGKISIPDEELPAVICHIERYFAKMDVASPFERDMKQFFGSEDVKTFTIRDFERALIRSGAFSKKAAMILSSKMNLGRDEMADILENLRGLKGKL